MNNLQTMSDKTAIVLSLLCALHCLAVPVVTVLLPSVSAFSLAGEAFHFWLLAIVLPISAFALMMGCKKHKRYHLLIIGGSGLIVLCLAAFLGHDVLGEVWEKILTMLGASLIALGHVWNYRKCLSYSQCNCTEPNDPTTLTP